MSSRSPSILELSCIACIIENVEQPSATEEHHLNLGGKAGQKRRGDAYSIPLCSWHHRGEPNPYWVTASWMSETYGPSLAKQSKRFRERYGTDDELLAMTNQMLGNV